MTSAHDPRTPLRPDIRHAHTPYIIYDIRPLFIFGFFPIYSSPAMQCSGIRSFVLRAVAKRDRTVFLSRNEHSSRAAQVGLCTLSAYTRAHTHAVVVREMSLRHDVYYRP